MIRPKVKQWLLILAGLACLVLIVGMVALCTGSAGIDIKQIPHILLQGPNSAEYSILMRIRLPRILLGMAIGGALSLAGTLLQGMFRNPLVEPYTLGISGGASLGVCINILFGFYSVIGIIAYPLSGFIGASLVIFLVYSLNRTNTHVRSNRMLLTGVMISYVASSLVMLLMALAHSDDLQNIVLWIMGSLDEPNTALIKVACAGSLAGLFISYFFCMDLNALLLGDEEAANLGINTARTKKVLFITASFLTGLSVSVAGIIMFVGLIVPHFVRMMTGPDHRILLAASFLAGAAFLTASDVIARMIIAPLELPVGVITGIIGGVMFIWALAGKKQLWKTGDLMTANEVKPVLQVDHLNFGYKDKQILKDISFCVNPKEFLAVIGPNGCGKTTLIKTILKSETPDTGSIHIQGKDLKTLSNKDLARHMAAVMQTIDPAAMTVRDYVLLGRLPFFNRYQFFENQTDLDIADKYMELTGISALADSKVTQISGGERQLCAIARALTQKPDLLVLDEPTSHLDITHQKRILDLITTLKKELSLTVLMVLHDLNLAAEYADRLVLLSKKNGQVFSSGTPKAVLTESTIRTVYQTQVKVKPNPISQKPWIFIVNQPETSD